MKVEQLIKGQDEAKKLLGVAVEDNLPVLLVGDTGTGKTSLIREVAALYNKPYTRFSITGETTVDDFVGKYILKNGETIWQDGILLTAVKQGHYLVVDEVNAALPEILFVLHSLLDDDRYVIVPQKDNETVKPHKDFRFFATMNPVDEYAGTKELNKAFQSRFAMIIQVNYPGRKIEVEVLTERTGITRQIAQKMVDVAIGIRRAKQEEKVFYTLSTRDLLYWGKLHDKLGIHPAFIVTIRNKGGTDDIPVIEDLYKQVFSDYQKAEREKLQTNLEWFKEEHKKLEASKKDIRDEVEQAVRLTLDKDFEAIRKEKATLTKMETRIRDEIAKGLKAQA